MVVGALAAVVAVMVLDDDGQPGGDAPDQAAVAEVLVAARDVSDAIGIERDVAFAIAVGQEGVLAPGNGDTTTTVRAATDEAIVALQEAVAGLGSSAADVLQPALQSVDQLGTIRAEVDAYTGPRDVTQFEPVALPLHARYSTIVTAVLDAHARFPATIDDADLRRAAEVHALAVGQNEARLQLIRWVLAGALIESSEIVTNLGHWSTTYEQGQNDLTGLAEGTPYRAAADRLLADLEGDPAVAGAEEVMAGGQADLAAVVDFADPAATAWHELAQEVEQSVRAG